MFSIHILLCCLMCMLYLFTEAQLKLCTQMVVVHYGENENLLRKIC